jgi:UDP-2,3-diacylglucosamine pyrophosphatase LpxH
MSRTDDGELPVSIKLQAGSFIAPLQAISVVLTVQQTVAQIEILQRFVNSEPNPIEAVYVLSILCSSFHIHSSVQFHLPARGCVSIRVLCGDWRQEDSWFVQRKGRCLGYL